MDIQVPPNHVNNQALSRCGGAKLTCFALSSALLHAVWLCSNSSTAWMDHSPLQFIFFTQDLVRIQQTNHRGGQTLNPLQDLVVLAAFLLLACPVGGIRNNSGERHNAYIKAGGLSPPGRCHAQNITPVAVVTGPYNNILLGCVGHVRGGGKGYFSLPNFALRRSSVQAPSKHWV